MTRRAFVITAVNLALASALMVLVTHAGAPRVAPTRVLAFTVAFAVVGFFPIRLDFRRQQVTITLTDALLVVALFEMGPAGVAIAAASGEAAACMLLRMPTLKTLFNVSNRLAAASAAAVAFFAAGATSANELAGWAAALGAALVFAFLDFAPVAAILSAAEDRRYQDIVFQSGPPALLTTAAAAPIGIVIVDLYHQSPLAPALLIPLVAAVAINSRSAAYQRDEHLRVERLFAATSRTARLVSFTDAVASVATESRELVTGIAAVCAVPTGAGEWVGVVADDDGVHAAAAGEVDDLVELVGEHGAGEVEGSRIPASLLAVAPAAAELLLARPPDGSAIPVALGVLRGPGSDEQRRGRVETLAAFAAQASLTISNARLYEEVEAALRRQVDLNRQKGDFVAAVSHELRTPLTSVLGTVATVLRLRDRLSVEEQDRLLNTSVDQGRRLKRLIDDLLLVAAAEHTTIECERMPVDVTALTGAVARDVESMLGDRLVIEIEPGITAMRSDDGRLRQILANLLENAAKYAPTGPVEVTVSARDDQILFAVADHGPGIAPADRGRVFERFVQLDQSSTRTRGGTGLGLYLCRQLADALGGQLDLTESLGGGACFTLSVPSGGPATAPAEGQTACHGMARRPTEAASSRPPGRRRPADQSAPELTALATGGGER